MYNLKFNKIEKILIAIAFGLGVTAIATYILLNTLYYGSYPYDGPFQTLFSLQRISHGYFPGKDFFFFHGNGIPYVHYPIFFLFGENIFSSQFAESLVHALTILVPIYIIFRYFFGVWAGLIAVVNWIAVSCFSYFDLPFITFLSVFQPFSTLGLRTFMVFVIAITITAIYLKDRIRIKDLVGLAMLCGMAFLLGAEHGIYSSFLALLFVLFYGFKRKQIFLAAFFVLLLPGAYVFIHLIFFGNLSGLKQFNNLMLDQNWYFGTYPHQFLRSLFDLLSFGGSHFSAYKVLGLVLLLTIPVGLYVFKKSLPLFILTFFITLEALIGLLSNTGYVSFHYAAPVLRAVFFTIQVCLFLMLFNAKPSGRPNAVYLRKILVTLFFVISAPLLFYVVCVTVDTKLSGKYSKKLFGGVYLSERSIVEPIPPGPIFDHAPLLEKYRSLRDGRPVHNADHSLARLTKFYNLAGNWQESFIAPFTGFYLGKFYAFGISEVVCFKMKRADLGKLRLGDELVLNYKDNVVRLVFEEISADKACFGGRVGVQNGAPVGGRIISSPVAKDRLNLYRMTYQPYIADGLLSTGATQGLLVEKSTNLKKGTRIKVGSKHATVVGVRYFDKKSCLILLASDKNTDNLVAFIDTMPGSIEIDLSENVDFEERILSKEQLNSYTRSQHIILPLVFENSNEFEIFTDFGVFSLKPDGKYVFNVQGPNFLTASDLWAATKSSSRLPIVYRSNSVSSGPITQLKLSDKVLWSAYTGLLNFNDNSLNPSGVDYIIHALGADLRRDYVKKFVDYRPELVQLTNRNFDSTDFHGWSLVTSWPFYREVLTAYEPVFATDYSQVWIVSKARNHMKSSTNEHASADVIEIPKKGCGLQLYEVTASYRFFSKKKVPFFSNLSRAFIYTSGNSLNVPVPLPRYENKIVFPVVGYPGEKITISPKLYQFFGKNEVFHLDALSVQHLDYDAKHIGAMFLPPMDLGLRLGSCGRFSYE